MTDKPTYKNRMYHQTEEIRPRVCRKAGCIELACKRYEDPKHAWNDFCTTHADEVEAIVNARGPATIPHGSHLYKY